MRLPCPPKACLNYLGSELHSELGFRSAGGSPSGGAELCGASNVQKTLSGPGAKLVPEIRGNLNVHSDRSRPPTSPHPSASESKTRRSRPHDALRTLGIEHPGPQMLRTCRHTHVHGVGLGRNAGT